MLTVASWNMHKGPASWERLESLMSVGGVSVALVQEARRPRALPDGWQTKPPASEPDRWRIAVPGFRIDTKDGSRKETNRWWASAVVSSGALRVTPREPVELHLAADGEFPCSHPGQFAVSDVALTGDGTGMSVRHGARSSLRSVSGDFALSKMAEGPVISIAKWRFTNFRGNQITNSPTPLC